ncbi:class I hydrophobin superfamily [Pleurotus ostreatus PC15]|uniref:Unclassified hydrophobin 9 n=1 Tax=Pleurotus ostreatus (strain PC15) TaxID=1137138 RepID=HYD9_PLEO1|nr:class I hydrophobin superfamily [Pleurotus ostreatus PC15]
MFFFNTKPIVFLVVLSVVATFAAATPAMLARGGGSSCAPSTSLKCCDHVGTFSEVSPYINPLELVGVIAALLGLVGGLFTSVTLALTCSGIDIGGSCNSQTVCCENVVFNGLVNVGCTAIDIL